MACLYNSSKWASHLNVLCSIPSIWEVWMHIKNQKQKVNIEELVILNVHTLPTRWRYTRMKSREKSHKYTKHPILIGCIDIQDFASLNTFQHSNTFYQGLQNYPKPPSLGRTKPCWQWTKMVLAIKTINQRRRGRRRRKEEKRERRREGKGLWKAAEAAAKLGEKPEEGGEREKAAALLLSSVETRRRDFALLLIETKAKAPVSFFILVLSGEVNNSNVSIFCFPIFGCQLHPKINKKKEEKVSDKTKIKNKIGTKALESIEGRVEPLLWLSTRLGNSTVASPACPRPPTSSPFPSLPPPSFSFSLSSVMERQPPKAFSPSPSLPSSLLSSSLPFSLHSLSIGSGSVQNDTGAYQLYHQPRPKY